MPAPTPFAACRANLGTWHTAPQPRFPAVWLFLLAALVLPPLLAFIATAFWAGLDVLLGRYGTLRAVIALTGIAALPPLCDGTRAWPLVPRCRSSRWWRWQWLRGCETRGSGHPFHASAV